MKYSYRVEASARDCDGPMSYPIETVTFVDYDALTARIGRLMLSYSGSQTTVYVTETQADLIYSVHQPTDEGHRRAVMTIWPEDEDGSMIDEI